MEFWLTLLVALPGALISALQAYDWCKARKKQPTDECLFY
jgi:hypothetical protein